MASPKTLCVYCGSSVGVRTVYRDAAVDLGIAMVRRGLRLVYGGGRIGLMGALADSVLAAGGQAVGIIPQDLVQRELAHSGLTELRVVGSMHQRKHQMAELADAFLALPGGYGTLDELCEVLGWAQLGLHAKPIVLVNIAGYYDPLLAMLDRAVQEGFLKPQNRRHTVEAATIDHAMQLLQSVWDALPAS